MQLDALLGILEQYKAQNIVTINLENLTDIADTMVICSGTSSTHIQGISRKVIQAAKQPNQRPPHAEGEEQGEWILIDLGDIIVNIMKPETRNFYDLESLWQEE